ncbi:MAG: hypothetical protein JWN72_1482 [Thermoleophilia bacterium]|nr:hypothetical protein [Thermoleophilia bacterium]
MSAIAPTTASMPGCSMPDAAPTTPTSPPAAAPDLATVIQQLTAVATQLTALVQALQGQQQLTPASTPASTPPAPITVAPTTPLTPTVAPTPADPLAGFIATGDAAEKAALGTALGTIGSTSVGGKLLGAVRNQNVTLDILDDAAFDAATGGTHTGAAAVASDDPAGRKVFVRASSMAGDPMKLRHTLAHELTHIAQYQAGENIQTYATGIGAAANGLTAAQLATGRSLMFESGSETVASSIDAELSDPVNFRAKAAGNIPAVEAAEWKLVNESGYNPQGFALTQFVSPTALALVHAAVG